MADILTNLDDEECCGQGCSQCLTKEPYPDIFFEEGSLLAEFFGGKLDGARLELCGPKDCRCGGCEVE